LQNDIILTNNRRGLTESGEPKQTESPKEAPTVEKVKGKLLRKGEEVVRETIQEKVKEKISRNFKFGTLLEDEQYSDPDINDRRNRISCDFLTSLKTNLTDSVVFNDRAIIVKTWSRVLTPGSIWEFNFHHHLGDGIDLNYVIDLKGRNVDHPSGYVFVLEYIGDRRGRIKRAADSDFFTGYSPAKLNIEFEFKYRFLYEDKGTTERPLFYRQKKREEDFEENSEFEKIFTPDREAPFNINYDNIIFNESNKDKKADFILEYDQNLLEAGNNTLLMNLQKDFENNGLDSNGVSEDDVFFNLQKNPSKNPTDYQGPDSSPPPSILDLDGDE